MFNIFLLFFRDGPLFTWRLFEAWFSSLFTLKLKFVFRNILGSVNCTADLRSGIGPRFIVERASPVFIRLFVNGIIGRTWVYRTSIGSQPLLLLTNPDFIFNLHLSLHSLHFLKQSIVKKTLHVGLSLFNAIIEFFGLPISKCLHLGFLSSKLFCFYMLLNLFLAKAHIFLFFSKN